MKMNINTNMSVHGRYIFIILFIEEIIYTQTFQYKQSDITNPHSRYIFIILFIEEIIFSQSFQYKQDRYHKSTLLLASLEKSRGHKTTSKPHEFSL